MAISHKILSQTRPSATTASTVYSPAGSIETVIKSICICNTSASSASYSIYLDADDETYDEASALFWQVPLAAGATAFYDLGAMGFDGSGGFAVQTDTASALTFTISGAEFS